MPRQSPEHGNHKQPKMEKSMTLPEMSRSQECLTRTGQITKPHFSAFEMKKSAANLVAKPLKTLFHARQEWKRER